MPTLETKADRNHFRSAIFEEAARVGHPDPANATWGEVNVLGVAGLREGRLPSRDEAQRFLDWCERESDLNDTLRGA